MFDLKSAEGKTFWELMAENRKPGSTASRSSKKAAHGYFLLVTCTVPYFLVVDVLPAEFSDLPDNIRESSAFTYFMLKLLIVFVSLETLVNWCCCQLVSTHLIGTRDRPTIERTLWDDEVGTPDDIRNHPDYCEICKLVAPYGSKTHHCFECNQCIIRRDHHCFMVGKCIGYYNQRYFAMFTFYIGLGSLISFYYLRRYLLRFIAERDDFSWTEYFLPLTLKHAVFGRVVWKEFLFLFYCYTFVWTTMLGIGFFFIQMSLIFTGQTFHEFKKHKPVRTYRTVSENFREVFGPCWIANFIIPMQLVFKQTEYEQPLLFSEYHHGHSTQNGGVNHLLDGADVV